MGITRQTICTWTIPSSPREWCLPIFIFRIWIGPRVKQDLNCFIMPIEAANESGVCPSLSAARENFLLLSVQMPSSDGRIRTSKDRPRNKAASGVKRIVCDSLFRFRSQGVLLLQKLRRVFLIYKADNQKKRWLLGNINCHLSISGTFSHFLAVPRIVHKSWRKSHESDPRLFLP